MIFIWQHPLTGNWYWFDKLACVWHGPFDSEAKATADSKRKK